MSMLQFDAQTRAAVLRTIAAVLLLGEVRDSSLATHYFEKSATVILRVFERLNLRTRQATVIQFLLWQLSRIKQ